MLIALCECTPTSPNQVLTHAARAVMVPFFFRALEKGDHNMGTSCTCTSAPELAAYAIQLNNPRARSLFYSIRFRLLYCLTKSDNITGSSSSTVEFSAV